MLLKKVQSGIILTIALTVVLSLISVLAGEGNGSGG